MGARIARGDHRRRDHRGAGARARGVHRGRAGQPGGHLRAAVRLAPLGGHPRRAGRALPPLARGPGRLAAHQGARGSRAARRGSRSRWRRCCSPSATASASRCSPIPSGIGGRLRSGRADRAPAARRRQLAAAPWSACRNGSAGRRRCCVRRAARDPDLDRDSRGGRPIRFALGREREMLRRLREDGRAALLVMGKGLAFTAYGWAAVVAEELEVADTVVAVELRVERVQDHLADGRTEMVDGARWRWTDDAAGRIRAEDLGRARGACRGPATRSRLLSSSASPATGTRTCSSVSRSRRVTVSSSIVWWSTVIPHGRADLVLAPVALADRAARRRTRRSSASAAPRRSRAPSRAGRPC